jgi:uncharacterized delta-60 repeat protein
MRSSSRSTLDAAFLVATLALSAALSLFGGQRAVYASSTKSVASYDYAHDVIAASGGGAIAVGESRLRRSHRNIALARYALDGALDPSFGDAGLVVTNLGKRSFADGAMLEPDGQIVIVGAAGERFMIARYDPDGTLDRGFGERGVVTVNVGPNKDRANAAIVSSSGEIVVVGHRGGPMRNK